MIPIASQQVSWWSVHEFLAALVSQANTLPVAGTPSWCALDDSDPVKLLAVAVAGEHHVLRMEIAQEARCEAAKAVAASTDWPKVAREIQQREDFRTSRQWARREVTR